MKEFVIKRYNSFYDVFAASLGENSLSLQEADDISIYGVTSDGNKVQVEFGDIYESVKEMGVWGWVDEDNLIHFWANKNASIGDLVHFFAHEIGHRIGKPCKDDLKEELRAETYGDAAELAYKLATNEINYIY